MSEIDTYKDNLDGYVLEYFIKDYTEFVYEKAITKPDHLLFGWENGMLGLCAEVGELANKMKKQLYQDVDIDDNDFKEEFGDIFWYLIYTVDAMGFDFIDIIKMNIDKLEKRYVSNK